jgi:hypothetical protein
MSISQISARGIVKPRTSATTNPVTSQNAEKPQYLAEIKTHGFNFVDLVSEPDREPTSRGFYLQPEIRFNTIPE